MFPCIWSFMGAVISILKSFDPATCSFFWYMKIKHHLPKWTGPACPETLESSFDINNVHHSTARVSHKQWYVPDHYWCTVHFNTRTKNRMFQVKSAKAFWPASKAFLLLLLFRKDNNYWFLYATLEFGLWIIIVVFCWLKQRIMSRYDTSGSLWLLFIFFFLKRLKLNQASKC